MHIPGGRQDGTKATGSSACPLPSFILDLGDQDMNQGLGPIEDAIIALLPNHPWRQEGNGGEAFAHQCRRVLPGP